MLQWKKFQFFDKEVVKNETLSELFKKLPVNATASGRGFLIFGSTNGFLSVVDREFKPVTFQAHEYAITHLQQLVHRNILISVGNDDEAVSPTIKIWNFDKVDRDGVPFLVRSIRLQKLDQPVPVTAFRCTEDLSQIAVGLCNGQIVVIRGTDVSRDRFPKQKILSSPSDNPISGLVWRTLDQHVILYAVTSKFVASYWTTAKDKRVELDAKGADIGCVTQSDDGDAVIGRDEAVYFYMPESLGACFGFEGPKQLLLWFRSYLLTVGQTGGVSGGTSLNIYDLKNKFVAYSGTRLPPVQHVVAEWGSLFVLTADGGLLQLEEKDTQTKLDTLFKKNLYSVAINLARTQQCENAVIVDIYRKYGDHLHSKGDYDGAMQQYLCTIGRLEPSYVIRKFLDAQRIHNLTSYLEALHERNAANADHTTLLLNCVAKLKDVDKLDRFIKRPEAQFEVETAIKVCRQAGYHKHALYLARAHRRHAWALRILLDDLRDYEQALQHLATLRFDDVVQEMQTHGKTLLESAPVRDATLALLLRLCTGYRPSEAALLSADDSLKSGSSLPPVTNANAATSSASGELPPDSHSLPSALSSGLSSFKSTTGAVFDSLSNATKQFHSQPAGHASVGAVSTQGAAASTATSSTSASPASTPHTSLSSIPPASSLIGVDNDKNSSASLPRASPAQFIHIFVNQSSLLVSFLETIVEQRAAPADRQVYTTLLELYLKLGATGDMEAQRKALELLNSKDAQFDVDHALMLCEMHDFRPGLLRLYELTQMYDEVVRLHIAAGDHKSVVQTCQRYGEAAPTLWLRALRHFAKLSPQCDEELREVIGHIERHNLLPPLAVVQALASNENAALGAIKPYVMRRVARAETRRRDDARRAAELQEETAAMRAEIAELRGGAVLFQANKCSNCSSAIELPSVHFLCKHSYHARCLDEADSECPLCSPERQDLLERAAAQMAAAERHEEFFKELERADDGFDVVAEHIGKNIFNQLVFVGNDKQNASSRTLTEAEQRQQLFR